MEVSDENASLAKMNNCWNCIKSVDSFALKDTQILVMSSSDVIVPVAQIQVIADYSDNAPTYLARLGPPPLASFLTKTVVLRT